MGKFVRILIAISLVLGITVLARNNVAWAGPAAEADQSALAQDDLNDPGHDDDPGTVKPPPGKTMICKKGVYSVGGSSVLRVTKLAKRYCVKASTTRRSRATGTIPDGAGRLLSNAVFLQMLYRDHPILKLPEKYGQVQICFAVPHHRHAKIYFLNSSGNQSGNPTWVPLRTTVRHGVACASAQITGSYALIGK